MKYFKMTVILLSIIMVLAGCGSAKEPKQAVKPPSSPPAEDQQREEAPPAQPAGKKLKSVDYVKFIDEQNGLAVSGGKAYRTQDGGATWVDITPDSTGSINERALFFIDKDNGWICTGTADQNSGEEKGKVFVTHDGGSSWKKSDVAGLVSPQMYFLDKSNGWILDHRDAAMMHEAVAVLRTTDGGSTWESVSETNPQNEKQGDLPLSGHKSGFTFVDTDIGYVTGYMPVDGKVYLYRTADGGQAWQDISFNVDKQLADGEYSSYPPVFFNGKNGILPIGDGEKFAVYKTTDGGKTWGNPKVLKAAVQDVRMSFIDANNWIVADNKYIYSTMDGGRTWEKTQPEMDIANATEITFASAKQGYMIIDNKLYATNDGGKSWR